MNESAGSPLWRGLATKTAVNGTARRSPCASRRQDGTGLRAGTPARAEGRAG
ncbi:hypothetical protein ACQPZP_42775 [Spirillospora sp. CA-142024]|uniref:hypothetical protein n=1 Tax=Spirillospora sp. CA-142024 TaxID=3240036 RepID=UPI003D8DACF0